MFAHKVSFFSFSLDYGRTAVSSRQWVGFFARPASRALFSRIARFFATLFLLYHAFCFIGYLSTLLAAARLFPVAPGLHRGGRPFPFVSLNTVLLLGRRLRAPYCFFFLPLLVLRPVRTLNQLVS